MLKKIILWPLLVLSFVLVVTLLVLWFLTRRELPSGEAGAKAETLTQGIEQAVNLAEWHKTAAVSFTFDAQGTHHFRDNKRGYREVRWKKGGQQYVVQYDQSSNYIAWHNKQQVSGDIADELYKEAYARHTNDFFWLHPFSQLRAPGAQRYYVSERALLVQYESGGVTPGDSFLIITDEFFKPIRWQIWVSIIPLPGYEFSFSEWHSCKTKAHFSLQHNSLLLNVPIRDLHCYARYPQANGVDRFRELLSQRR